MKRHQAWRLLLYGSRLPTLSAVLESFRRDHTDYSESELVLIVTPELVHPMEKEEVPPLPGSDLFEPGDRAAKTNGEGRRFKFLLELRDRNRIGDECDAQRLRTVLVPTPAVPAASDYDHQQEHE